MHVIIVPSMAIPVVTEECSRYHVRSSSPQASPSDKGTIVPSSPKLSNFPLTTNTIFSTRPPWLKILLPLMYVFCFSLSQIASKIGSSIRAKMRTCSVQILRKLYSRTRTYRFVKMPWLLMSHSFGLITIELFQNGLSFSYSKETP